MTDADAADAVLALEPEDLDGHTIDDLEDYLERDRQPADASIDNSASCQIALAALQRLHDIAGDYLDRADAPTGTDEDWISTVLATLPLDTRAGRRFPYASSDPRLTAHVTEAAVRGLIRTIGDAVPGLLVGKVDIHDDQQNPDTVDLEIEAALFWGAPLRDVEQLLRIALHDRLPVHTPFAVRRIDIRIVDLITPDSSERNNR